MSSVFRRQETSQVPAKEPGTSSFGECGNCGALLTGPYCARCGEKKLTPKDYSIPHFAEEALGVFTHLDNKFFRTLRLLFTKPGQLSNAYFHGGRSRYTKPLTVFVIINIVFFLAQPHTRIFNYKFAHYAKNPVHAAAIRDHLTKSGESQQSYTARFDANLQNQKKSLLIVSVPVLALAMVILFVGTGRTYAEHLVFSVQVYAFLLSYLAAVAVFMLLFVGIILRGFGPATAPIIRLLDREYTVDAILVIGLATYVYLGLRRAYQVSRTRAALSAVVLAATAGMLIGVYHNLLFYATFWTT